MANHPSLQGRILFADAEIGTPESAIRVMNNAKNDWQEIQRLVKQGYIIRTRADSDTEQARNNDKTSFAAAQRSGAQIISTDYYGQSRFFRSDYIVFFPSGNQYLRANSSLVP